MLTFYVLGHSLLGLVVNFLQNMFRSSKYKYAAIGKWNFPNHKGRVKLYALAERAEALIYKLESLDNE